MQTVYNARTVEIQLSDGAESRTKLRTRASLMNAALRLFAKNGLFSTSMVDIAEEAKVTRRTLYNYYETKEVLIEDLQPLVLDAFLGAVGDVGDDVIEYLRRMHRILDEDSTLRNYLVKAEYYLGAAENLTRRDLLLGPYLAQHSPIRRFVENRVSAEPDAVATVIIESFLSYIERITYRMNSYRQEGTAVADDFTFYLRTFLPALFEEVDA